MGYNILNEPHPERLYNTADFAVYNVEQSKVQKNLFGFYGNVVDSIRQVDSETPIILDSSSYADSNAFDKFEPVDNSNILFTCISPLLIQI